MRSTIHSSETMRSVDDPGQWMTSDLAGYERTEGPSIAAIEDPVQWMSQDLEGCDPFANEDDVANDNDVDQLDWPQNSELRRD